MDKITTTISWSGKMEDFMACDAGRAYILNQLDPNSGAIEPEFKVHGEQGCGYEVYPDGSLWYLSNAEDEVWCDAGDFLRDSLIPGIEACSHAKDWSGWDSLDEMDQAFLIHLLGEEEARESIPESKEVVAE